MGGRKCSGSLIDYRRRERQNIFIDPFQLCCNLVIAAKPHDIVLPFHRFNYDRQCFGTRWLQQITWDILWSDEEGTHNTNRDQYCKC